MATYFPSGGFKTTIELRLAADLVSVGYTLNLPFMEISVSEFEARKAKNQVIPAKNLVNTLEPDFTAVDYLSARFGYGRGLG